MAVSAQPPPLQPAKAEPAAGVAVSVTAVPLLKPCEQVAPQARPTGALLTVPVPVPDLVTLSEKDCTKLAVTDAAAWGDAPAGCLFLLPLWNPVLVAEQVGTLAAVTRGRFIFQCGLGYDEAQFAAMGIALKYRPSAFEEESYSIVQRLLRGETVSSSGRSKFRDARLALRPAENVEYWIGGSAQPAIDRAVAHPRRGARSGRVLSRTLQGPRRTPKAAVAIRRDIYVGESAAEAEQAILTTGSRGIPAPALVAGSVESVAQQFAQLAVLGSTDVIVRHLTNDWPKVLASLARLRRVREALAGV